MKYATTLFIACVNEVLAPLVTAPFVGPRRLVPERPIIDRGLDSELVMWLDPEIQAEPVLEALRLAGFDTTLAPEVPNVSRRRIDIRRGTARFQCPRCKGKRFVTGRDTGRRRLCTFCKGVVVSQGVPEGVSYGLRLYAAVIRAHIAKVPAVGEVTFGLRSDGSLDTEAALVMAASAAEPVADALRAVGFVVSRRVTDDSDLAMLDVTRGTAVFVCPRCNGASSERLSAAGEPCGFCLRRDLTPLGAPPC